MQFLEDFRDMLQFLLDPSDALAKDVDEDIKIIPLKKQGCHLSVG